jgi:hypothetical protein
MGKDVLKRSSVFKKSRNLQMICAAVTHLDEGPSLEILLTLKVDKPIISLVVHGDKQYPST